MFFIKLYLHVSLLHRRLEWLQRQMYKTETSHLVILAPQKCDLFCLSTPFLECTKYALIGKLSLRDINWSFPQLLLKKLPNNQHILLNKISGTSYSTLYTQELSSEIRKSWLRNSIPEEISVILLFWLSLQDSLSCHRFETFH